MEMKTQLQTYASRKPSVMPSSFKDTSRPRLFCHSYHITLLLQVASHGHPGYSSNLFTYTSHCM